jgi:hypothetical protein
MIAAATARMSTGDWLAVLGLIALPLLCALARIHVLQRRARRGVPPSNLHAAGSRLADDLVRHAVRQRRPW